MSEICFCLKTSVTKIVFIGLDNRIRITIGLDNRIRITIDLNNRIRMIFFFQTLMANKSDVSSYFQLDVEERAFCTWVRLLINGGLGGIICVCGLAGNIVSYLVLNKGKNNAQVATFLLRCLALTDNFFLLVWFINFSIRDLLRYISYNSLAWRYVRQYSFPTIYVAQCATIWLTVLIAAARYIAVCMPYIARRVCSLANTKLAVSGLYFLVICYNLPRFFETQLLPINGSLQIRDTWLGKNETYRFVYWELLYYIFTLGLPLVVLIVLNVRLTVAYRQIAERRRRMRGASTTSRSAQDDANITLVMIVVIAVFVFCQLPARIVQMIWSYHFPNCRTAPFYMSELSTILEVLNSSVNFLIYSVIRPQFRRNLSQFCCRSKRENSADVNVRLVTSCSEPNGECDKTEATMLDNKAEIEVLSDDKV